MNWDLLTPLLITSFVALMSWFVVNFLNARRERINKRRELITQYLIEAYRRLERSTGRSQDNSLTYSSIEFVKDLETAIADIQLLGTPKQVELVQEFAESFNKGFRSSDGFF